MVSNSQIICIVISYTYHDLIMFREEPFQANHETNGHRANQIGYESYK